MMPRLLTTVWTIGLLSVVGCNSPLFRSQSPEQADLEFLTEEVEDDATELVGYKTVPVGMNYLKIEGVALVNGLEGTGSDPSPSPLRTALIGEMQSHEVSQPQTLLESTSNSLVVVRGYLPPGVQKGDWFDVEVVVPAKSKTSSLRGGYLLRSRMREMRVMENAVRSGHVVGLAQGSVLVDSIFEGTSDGVLETRGRVLGGGQSQIARPLGIAIRGESTVRQAAQIGTVINARFHKSDRSGQSGVARPMRDNYIEIAMHPRYKNNVGRYMRVIRSIAIRETPGERMIRIESLERRLLEPTTSARAALQLEAIGEDAAHILLKGLASSDPEVRFYAAEALAYLDREEAAKVLAWSAEAESAMRWHALTALAAMDHVIAYEMLSDLLHVSSSETRYGAFRALTARNGADPLVRGESLGGHCSYHVISSDGPPMIHLSRSQRPEIVLFGQRQPIEPPAFLFAGKSIMIKGLKDGRLKLTRFATGDKEDRVETCSADVDSMIRAIVALGGGYGEIVQAIQEARRGGYLQSRVAVNALARPGRTYYRDRAIDEETPEEPASDSNIRIANPIPDMFSNRLDGEQKPSRYSPDEISPANDGTEGSQPSFMGRMTNWFTK